jgi:hypothetical protein
MDQTTGYNAFHTVQLLYQKFDQHLPGNDHTWRRQYSHYSAVVASFLIEIVNITIHVPVIFQPSPSLYDAWRRALIVQ